MAVSLSHTQTNGVDAFYVNGKQVSEQIYNQAVDKAAALPDIPPVDLSSKLAGTDKDYYVPGYGPTVQRKTNSPPPPPPPPPPVNSTSPSNTGDNERRTSTASGNQPSTTGGGSTPTSPADVEQGKEKNVLNKYRSSNYIFTLAALDTQESNNPESYRNSTLKNVVLKSGGVGSAGVAVGPGGFDMFIDNVEIESLIGFNEKGNVSQPSLFKFQVIEPYSVNGFLEALKISAQAAGYPTYTGAWFVLKIQFAGYPDGDGLPEVVPEIDKATRYFVIGLNSVDVTVDERGTLYKCEGFNGPESVFGEVQGKLKKSIKMNGKKVFTVLYNLTKAINDQIKDDDKKTGYTGNDHDEYFIKFPTPNGSGYTGGDTLENSNVFGSSDVTDYSRNNNYVMPDPAKTTQPNATKAKGSAQPDPDQNTKNPASYQIEPVYGSTGQFPDGTPLLDCVTSVVRDSKYIRDIMKKIMDDPNSVIDDNGMVDYFIVVPQVINKATINQDAKRPYRTINYLVLPHKIYYKFIPGFANQNTDNSKLKQYSLREYNYIYTGKNVDLLKFNLHFNLLFFEDAPPALGQEQSPPSRDAKSNQNRNKPTRNSDSVSNTEGSGVPIGQYAQTSGPTKINSNSSAPLQADPYSVMAVEMHKAFINSTGLVNCEIEILGDPYFLVTGGIGNYLPGQGSTPQITTDGEANCIQGQVLVTLNFRNPIDIGPLSSGGRYQFDPQLVPFSGVYKVTSITSTFKEGVFRQRLVLLRIPGQILDSNASASSPSSSFTSSPDSLTSVQQNASPASSVINTDTGQSGSRADTLSLLNQQQRGLPSPGLPGELSNFTNATGGLGGNTNNLLTQVSGATPNLAGISRSPLQIYGNSIPLGSSLGIPLQTAGAIALQQKVLGPAALLNQVSNTLRVAGINSPALQLANSIVSKATNIINQVSVPGSGIGKGATVAYNPAIPVNNIISAGGVVTAQAVLSQGATLPSNATAIPGVASQLGFNAITAAANLGPQGANLIGGAQCVPSKTLATSADPLAIAAQFGVNPSQLAGLSTNLQSNVTAQLAGIAKIIPANTCLAQASAQGINLNSLSPKGLASLPPTAPNAIAPDAIADSAYLNTLGKNNLAKAYGVNNIACIPSSQLSASDLNSAISSAAGIKNPITSLSQQAGINVTSIADKTLSAYSSFSPLGGAIRSVEAVQGLANNVTGNINNVLSKSVISQFGSTSAGSNPLDKIMLNR